MINGIEKLTKALKDEEAMILEKMKSGLDVSRLVSISEGNTKMGKVTSVSLLPILTCPGRCNGTCGDRCYAKKLALLRPTVLRAYARNTAILKHAPHAFFKAVKTAMLRSEYFRFHVSGDITDLTYLHRIINACKLYPTCNVLIFTKRYELINAEIRNNGPLPKNLHLLFSGWTNLSPVNPYGLPETTVYTKDEEIKPEWTLCGGNCLDCAIHDGGCWNAKPGDTIAFKMH